MGLHDVEYFGQNNRTMRAGFDLSCSATTPYAAAFTLSEKYGNIFRSMYPAAVSRSLCQRLLTTA